MVDSIASKCHATRNDIVDVSSSFNFCKDSVRARKTISLTKSLRVAGGFRAPIFSRKCDRMLAILLVDSEFSEFPIG